MEKINKNLLKYDALSCHAFTFSSYYLLFNYFWKSLCCISFSQIKKNWLRALPPVSFRKNFLDTNYEFYVQKKDYCAVQILNLITFLNLDLIERAKVNVLRIT
jgi:hypothetical protein